MGVVKYLMQFFQTQSLQRLDFVVVDWVWMMSCDPLCVEKVLLLMNLYKLLKIPLGLAGKGVVTKLKTGLRYEINTMIFLNMMNCCRLN